MFAGQTNFFAVNLDPETEFRDYIYAVTTKMTVCEMYRRN
jgi:hypothetical protein